MNANHQELDQASLSTFTLLKDDEKISQLFIFSLYGNLDLTCLVDDIIGLDENFNIFIETTVDGETLKSGMAGVAYLNGAAWRNDASNIKLLDRVGVFPLEWPTLVYAVRCHSRFNAHPKTRCAARLASQSSHLHWPRLLADLFRSSYDDHHPFSYCSENKTRYLAR